MVDACVLKSCFRRLEVVNFITLCVISSHLISSQSVEGGGRSGTTDDVATIPFHLSLSSAALRESPNSIPVHSLKLSAHVFFCLSLLLALYVCRFGHFILKFDLAAIRADILHSFVTLIHAKMIIFITRLF